MKELMDERLLQKLDEWFETVADYGEEEDKQAYNQIKARIEQKPRVSREDLESFVTIDLGLAFEAYGDEKKPYSKVVSIFTTALTNRLESKGIEIVAKKDNIEK